jgi:hypothetical protein
MLAHVLLPCTCSVYGFVGLLIFLTTFGCLEDSIPLGGQPNLATQDASAPTKVLDTAKYGTEEISTDRQNNKPST